MKAGAASITINNDIGTLIQGAGDPDQRVEEIRDDLEANALYLTDGTTEILFVSCDLVGLETERVRRYKNAMADRADIPSDSIIIGCSHTHAGPVVSHTNYSKPVDEDYSQRLKKRLCDVAMDAVSSASPARIGWGTGHARLGYNRRVCYANGTHTMYREGGRDDEFTGLEGPDDTECLALAAFDEEGKIKAVLHHGTGHPASFYGGNVLSADFPGVARQLVRESYGKVPVLFFNGSEGDIAMRQQEHPQVTPDNREAQITRFGSALAGETLRIIHEMQPQDDMVIFHCRREHEYPVRQPKEEVVEEGRKVLERIDNGADVRGKEAIFAWGPVSLVEKYGEDGTDQLAFHVVIIGDLVIATHPCELFCQYQLDIKRRRPASQTFVFGITDGGGGYVPTLSGAIGGGYSGTPFAWARFSPEVGCQLVDEIAAMAYKLWSKSRKENDV
ncbi:MAG: hypothetical protein ACLFWL_12480 [Candidatus Brocadiia bacterium]